MSTYSLEILDGKKYKEDFEQNIRYSFEQYLYKKNFRVGNGIENEDELEHDLIYSRILSSEKCEITNYIKNVIEDRINKKPKKKKRKHISEEFEHESMYNNEDQQIFWESVFW